MIVIISCGAKKQSKPAIAGDMYTGSYFRSMRKYALSLVDEKSIYILSSKYGFVPFNQTIEPYEMVMGQSGSVSVEALKKQAKHYGIEHETVVAVGGKRYVTMCALVFDDVKKPLEGLGGMGYQLRWMKQNAGRV